MTLHKLDDFYPDYSGELFGGEDIKGTDVFAGESDDKIGTVKNALVDASGQFRYLVIDTGFWFLGKDVLLPIGRCRFDASSGRVQALGIVDKDQAENLPEYTDDMVVDYEYEEQVRTAYRTPGSARNVDRNTYRHEDEPELYGMRDRDHQKLKLYEEKLVASKTRQKIGEVSVGKQVKTNTATVSVPVEKERVVVERTTPTNRTAVPGEATFDEGEVARIAVHEETANISKQAFVREEVEVRKETDQEAVTGKETVRREELDVDRTSNTNGKNPMKQR